MSIQTRRERERAERERLIVTAARELAEAEGWDAVTTRRLAAEIEYSQPVLYSHFRGKEAIMAAVAVEGCAELAAEFAGGTRGRAGSAGRAPGGGLGVHRVRAAAARAVRRDVHAFRAPAVRDGRGPAALWDAFNELAAAVAPIAAPEDDPGLLTETYWAGLHGLVTLMRSGRLPEEAHERRLELLIRHFPEGAG